MKYFLVLLISIIGLSAHSDENSANSARSGENSPVSKTGQGEDPTSGAITKTPVKRTKGTDDMVLRNHKMDSVCEAEGNPEDCYDKTTAKKKTKSAKKKKTPAVEQK
jgi:hypothetical protein